MPGKINLNREWTYSASSGVVQLQKDETALGQVRVEHDDVLHLGVLLGHREDPVVLGIVGNEHLGQAGEPRAVHEEERGSVRVDLTQRSHDYEREQLAELAIAHRLWLKKKKGRKEDQHLKIIIRNEDLSRAQHIINEGHLLFDPPWIPKVPTKHPCGSGSWPFGPPV